MKYSVHLPIASDNPDWSTDDNNIPLLPTDNSHALAPNAQHQNFKRCSLINSKELSIISRNK
jgi:hypothetical protein